MSTEPPQVPKAARARLALRDRLGEAYAIQLRAVGAARNVAGMSHPPPLDPFSLLLDAVERVTHHPADAITESVVDGLLHTLESRAQAARAEARDVAFVSVLDIGAALVSLGAVRDVGTFLLWLRRELPERVRQLDRARSFYELPPVAPRSSTPAGATWH